MELTRDQMIERMVADQVHGTHNQPYLIVIKPLVGYMTYLDVNSWDIKNGSIMSGFLKKAYEIIDCRMIESVVGMADDVQIDMFCDEEFLLNSPRPPMNYPATLIANTVILGTVIVTGGVDNEGNEKVLYGTDVASSIMKHTTKCLLYGSTVTVPEP